MEVVDVADLQVRKSDFRVVAGVITAPLTLPLRAFSVRSPLQPFLLLESCGRCFESVCVDMFGLAQRVHIPLLRTLAHLAATAPSQLNSGSMSKDIRVLMWKDLQQLSCFDSCWGWSVFAVSTVVFVSQNLLKLSYKQLCRDMELTLMNELANHAFSLIESHEHLNSSQFPGSFGTIENPTLVSAILNDEVVGYDGDNGEAEHVPQHFHCKEGFLDRCGECEHKPRNEEKTWCKEYKTVYLQHKQQHER